MTAYEKEFALPHRTKGWPFKAFDAAQREDRSVALIDDLKQTPIAPVENVANVVALRRENFKWTPEKEKKQSPKPPAEESVSWPMPFMKVRLLLCFLGASPLTWKKPHSPSTHPLQSTLLYSIAVYSAISVSVGIAGSDLIGMLSNTVLTEDQKVLNLELTIQLFPHLLGPILWIDTYVMADGFEAWVSLTKDYFRATGKKLENRRVGMELAFNFCIISFPIIFYLTLIMMIRGLDLKMSYAPAYFHGGMIQTGLALVWIGTCYTLRDVADDITVAFKEKTEKHGATPEILVEFRRLWVLLRSICDLMGSMIAPLLLTTHTLVLITLFLYEGLIFINRGESVSGITHLCGSVLFVMELFFVCRASHFTALHMKYPLESVLDTLPVATLSTTAEREVIMFYLVENAKPAETTLNGFVVVNKSLFSSMLAAVSTYLIVLMQFHQSSGGLTSQNTTVSFV